MFAFVVHCAGTPLNIEVNFWVFECNAPFHRRPSATPYQRSYSDVNRQEIVFNISLSLLDCCNKKTITFKFQRYAPDSPAWQLHLRQLHQLGSRIRAESRRLHQLGSRSLAAAFKYHLGQSCADTISFSDLARRRKTTLLCHCSSCRAASFRGSVAVRPSFPALPAVRYSKLPSVAVSAQGIIETGRSFHRRVAHVTAARATISVL